MAKVMATILVVIVLMSSGCSGGGGGLFGGGGDGGTTVYVTKSGNSYHRSGCSAISGRTVFSMDKSAAINAGYGQCQICRP